MVIGTEGLANSESASRLVVDGGGCGRYTGDHGIRVCRSRLHSRIRPASTDAYCCLACKSLHLKIISKWFSLHESFINDLSRRKLVHVKNTHNKTDTKPIYLFINDVYRKMKNLCREVLYKLVYNKYSKWSEPVWEMASKWLKKSFLKISHSPNFHFGAVMLKRKQQKSGPNYVECLIMLL